MPLDVGVFDEQYRYKKHLHIDKAIHGLLFKKLVTEEEYPSLGRAKDESEDITVTPAEIPALVKDLTKLEKYLKKEKLMSPEVKVRCMEFVATMKDICQVAKKDKKNVEFIAGE